MLRNTGDYVRCRASAIPYDYWCMGKEEKNIIGWRITGIYIIGISTVDKALCVNTIELPVTGVQYGKKGGE